ncbi:hypothetical protein CDL15_Pgr017315 [Punica granatum]|uniref:Uncharacterized protein n=1 Tax=Punica granatum TaxID=22663 RepID=A0A218Y273_PUNGR|nr:hypothetical protein CDL15_Pgr017315 [Punica granatum]
MLEFCAKRNIAADIELIWMDQVNGGHGEVRQVRCQDRFMIDVANSLQSRA